MKLEAPGSRRLTGPIIVAAQDTDDVHGAMQTAQQLARRDDVGVYVLGVVPPLDVPSGMLSDADRLALDEARQQKEADRLRQRVNRAVGISGHFAVDVSVGRRSRVLAREARARNAAVVITGLGQLGTDARVPTEDATLQLVLEADVPVVAATATQLAEAGDVSIETVQLHGDPAAELLNAARTAVVDLVACGGEGTDGDAVGRPPFRHAGSTSLALIHRAPCSVLVAPPESDPGA